MYGRKGRTFCFKVEPSRHIRQLCLLYIFPPLDAYYWTGRGALYSSGKTILIWVACSGDMHKPTANGARSVSSLPHEA